MAPRLRFGFLATGTFVLFTFLYISMPGSNNNAEHHTQLAAKAALQTTSLSAGSETASQFSLPSLPSDLLTGGVIAPKLENATAKQELGRASWRLLHTIMARFPEKPTADESLALQTFVQLFARLYPCGDCAAHFQKLLAEYPPQTSSRNAAAGWACFVHNEVNARLNKELFDCNKIGDFYDCGCGDEDGKKDGKKAAAASDSKATPESVLGESSKSSHEDGPIELEKEEGLSRGG